LLAAGRVAGRRPPASQAFCVPVAPDLVPDAGAAQGASSEAQILAFKGAAKSHGSVCAPTHWRGKLRYKRWTRLITRQSVSRSMASAKIAPGVGKIQQKINEMEQRWGQPGDLSLPACRAGKQKQKCPKPSHLMTFVSSR
jgi:hypothetical protein